MPVAIKRLCFTVVGCSENRAYIRGVSSEETLPVGGLQLRRIKRRPSCSISDSGDCHGYCRFPAFLWQQHQQQHQQQQQQREPTSGGWFDSSTSETGAKSSAAVAERRWFERTVYGSSSSSSAWDSRREITARPTEIWTEQRRQTACASTVEDRTASTARRRHGGAGAGAGRMACYRRESASNVSCLAEEPSGKYRVLVADADG